MIAAVDDGVGPVVETLQHHQLLDDTLTIFSSDNGPTAEVRNWLDGANAAWTVGKTGGFRGHKGSLFDGGIREPFVISHPRALPAGRVCDPPAQMSDGVPTVLALAGIHTDITFDGDDVSNHLTGTAASPMLNCSGPRATNSRSGKTTGSWSATLVWTSTTDYPSRSS